MKTKAEIKHEWYEANKENVLAYNRAWRKANRLKVKAQNARYREANKAELAVKHKEYESNNREAVNATKREYKKNNRAGANENGARYYAQKTQSIPSWFNPVLAKAFYIHARFMTKHTGVNHEVDHIVPIRSDKVCGLHCHQNLQVITQSDNRKKSNILWPDMFERVA